MAPTRKSKTKAPRHPPSSTALGRVELQLEQVLDQNRATIEAVQSTAHDLEQRLGARIERVEQRLGAVEQVVRDHSAALARIEEKLEQKADRAELRALEERVLAARS